MEEEGVLFEEAADNSKQVSYLQYQPIGEEQFVTICQRHRTFPILYNAEFQLACKHEEFSCAVAQSEENARKNRNKTVLPYDHNRVILEVDEDYPSDYINASHVKSLIPHKSYIVTQGPMDETITDFWRMIWQQRVSCIVMLTKCFDFTKKMCSQYWPIHETEVYGPFKVQIDSVQELANYTLRRLKVWRIDCQEDDVREILHCYYTEWPCYTDAFIPALLDFRRRIRQIVAGTPELNGGKTVIHCNDGAGRSGVFAALDANLELLEKTQLLDVFGYLRTLKASRSGLVDSEVSIKSLYNDKKQNDQCPKFAIRKGTNVQEALKLKWLYCPFFTQTQLQYIYAALEEYLMCKQTWFPVSELPQQIRNKSDNKVRMNEFQREYQLICKLTPTYTIGDCAGSYRMENRMKNRDISVITADNFRPYLTSYQGTLDTDFINAVFIDTFKESKGCIVTEWPLADTISFFWSLIYDYSVSAVIVLVNPDSPQLYPPFWPDSSKSETYGPVFSVEQLSHNHFDYIKSWMFEIHKKIISLTDLMTGVKAEPKKCQFFQITNWPMDDKIPSTPASLIDLMILLERWRTRAGNGPIVLLSQDGKSRVGILCAAISCIEQIKQQGEVDIFTAVRTIRRYRPKIMPTLTEYKYAYEVVLHYVLHCLRKRVKGT